MSIQQVGIKFHVLNTYKSGNVRTYEAVFKCECGKMFIASYYSRLKTKSCGCLREKDTKIRQFKHGLSGTRTFISWNSMMNRCSERNKNDPHLYKGRGITVCKEWSDIKNFISDMGYRPENTTLDRINNDKGYYKENCRWATVKEQSRNRRTNKLLTIDGITKTIAEWSEHENVTTKYYTICKRLENGWDAKEAVFAKDRSKTLITINGTTKCIIDWAAHEGVTVKPSTISNRLNRGWEPERAVFEEPSDKHRKTAYKQNKK